MGEALAKWGSKCEGKESGWGGITPGPLWDFPALVGGGQESFWKKINTRTFLCVSCQPRGPSAPWGAVGDGPHDGFPAPVLDSPRGPL